MNFSVTDSILLITGMYFFSRGWQQGFLKTILTPLAFAVCGICAQIYFFLTGKMVTAFLIAVFGPFILMISLSMLLNLWQAHVNKNAPPALISRLAGALWNMTWKECFIVAVGLIVLLLPSWIPGLQQAREDIKKSYAYTLVSAIIIPKLPLEAPLQQLAAKLPASKLFPDTK